MRLGTWWRIEHHTQLRHGAYSNPPEALNIFRVLNLFVGAHTTLRPAECWRAGKTSHNEEAWSSIRGEIRDTRCVSANWWTQVRKGGLTRPVRARAERDAEHHEDRAGCLEAHGDGERADELEEPVRDL